MGDTEKGAEHFGSKPSGKELSYLWTHFNPGSEFLETTDADPVSAYILPEYGKSSYQRISVLFRQLPDNSRRELYTPRMAEYALKLILMEITQEYLDAQEKRSSLPPLISDMTEWLRLNCHRQLSIKEIAEEFHYNPEYLSYLFRKETGQTIIGYLNIFRIDLSKRLLSDRNVSIKEAAFSCGFNDEKYLSEDLQKAGGNDAEAVQNGYRGRLILLCEVYRILLVGYLIKRAEHHRPGLIYGAPAILPPRECAISMLILRNEYFLRAVQSDNATIAAGKSRKNHWSVYHSGRK